MNFKASLKAFGAVLWRERANIEAIVGGVLILTGTGIIISKATEAAEVTAELEVKNNWIHSMDETNGWADKKERSQAVHGLIVQAAKGYSKTYALGLGIQALGLTLEAVSQVTKSKEIASMSALAAAYATTLNAVKERVIADQGEEKWQEYLLGPQFTTVDVMPDGTIIQTTEPIEDNNTNVGLPPHCFFFDECNAPDTWEPDAQMNKKFLEDHLRWLNERLWAEGFLFENDIRRDLGVPIVKSGWTAGIFATDKEGNRNWLSFGLDAKNPRAQAFRDGIEPSIVIQLNVEDNIIDQIRMELI